jgi:hypothetical protein
MRLFGWEFKKAKSNPDPTLVPLDAKRISKARITTDSDTDQSRYPQLPRSSDRYTTVSLADIKYGSSPDAILKILTKWDPDVSAGVWNFKSVCNSGFRATAYDTKGVPDAKLQLILDKILLRLNLVDSYEGFTHRYSVNQLCNMMIGQILLRGAIAAEAVVNDIQVLGEVAIVDPIRVLFKPDHTPFMKSGNKEVSLDIPTFFWEVLDPDPETPYENPPFLAAINAVMFRIAVMEDLQRVVKRIAYPRISIKVLEEVLIKNAPPHLKHNPIELEKWLRARLDEIKTQLETLRPEEALIAFNSVEVDYIANKENPTIDFRPLIEVIDRQIIAALKSLPTILGRNFSSSQTLSATESLMYTKSARQVQEPVEKMMSRILTLALLLEGSQGYVLFKYRPIELRPESELSQHRTMEADLTLKLLSLGFYTDTEAAERLTGSPTLPAGFKPLSGTGFYEASLKGAADEAEKATTPPGGKNPRADEKTGKGRKPATK